jgi:hypothetical protein
VAIWSTTLTVGARGNLRSNEDSSGSLRTAGTVRAGEVGLKVGPIVPGKKSSHAGKSKLYQADSVVKEKPLSYMPPAGRGGVGRVVECAGSVGPSATCTKPDMLDFTCNPRR